MIEELPDYDGVHRLLPEWTICLSDWRGWTPLDGSIWREAYNKLYLRHRVTGQRVIVTVPTRGFADHHIPPVWWQWIRDMYRSDGPGSNYDAHVLWLDPPPKEREEAPCSNCGYMTKRKCDGRPWCFRVSCPLELAMLSHADYLPGTLMVIDEVKPLYWFCTDWNHGAKYQRGRFDFTGRAYLWMPHDAVMWRDADTILPGETVRLVSPPQVLLERLADGAVFCCDLPSVPFGLKQVVKGHCERGGFACGGRAPIQYQVRDLATGASLEIDSKALVTLVMPAIVAPETVALGLAQGAFRVPMTVDGKPDDVYSLKDLVHYVTMRKVRSSYGNQGRVFECVHTENSNTKLVLEEGLRVFPEDY